MQEAVLNAWPEGVYGHSSRERLLPLPEAARRACYATKLQILLKTATDNMSWFLLHCSGILHARGGSQRAVERLDSEMQN